MSKDIEYKGKVYQLGMKYLFKDTKLQAGRMGTLTEIKDSIYPFIANNEYWVLCEELPASNEIGTITDGPVELIGGEAYMYTYKGHTYKGIYINNDERFYSYFEHKVSNCTNIKPLTVKEV
jgi:hypothetical protein